MFLQKNGTLQEVFLLMHLNVALFYHITGLDARAKRQEEASPICFRNRDSLLVHGNIFPPFIVYPRLPLT